jgi:outer membrane protein OmpA-like peptidoglycan-associated protein
MSHHTSHVQHRESSRSALFALGFAAAAVFLTSVPVAAQVPAVATKQWQPGQKGKVEGPIMMRSGDELLVRQESSNDVTSVTLNDNVQIESPSGLLNIDRKRQNVDLLKPGLYIKVRGRGGDRGNLVATRISFHKGAVKVQNSISAGEVELREKEAATRAEAKANTDSIINATARARDSLKAFTTRMANLDSYDAKFRGSVGFATGSAVLDEAAKGSLDFAARQAMGLTNYVVEIAGYTDDTGTPAENQRLSERRTAAVVSYLAGTHNIPLRRFVNPTGLGESRPIGDNSTAAGRSYNRRVEVRILLNRGLTETDGSGGR